MRYNYNDELMSSPLSLYNESVIFPSNLTLMMTVAVGSPTWRRLSGRMRKNLECLYYLIRQMASITRVRRAQGHGALRIPHFLAWSYCREDRCPSRGTVSCGVGIMMGTPMRHARTCLSQALIT